MTSTDDWPSITVAKGHLAGLGDHIRIIEKQIANIKAEIRDPVEISKDRVNFCLQLPGASSEEIKSIERTLRRLHFLAEKYESPFMRSIGEKHRRLIERNHFLEGQVENLQKKAKTEKKPDPPQRDDLPKTELLLALKEVGDAMRMAQAEVNNAFGEMTKQLRQYLRSGDLGK